MPCPFSLAENSISQPKKKLFISAPNSPQTVIKKATSKGHILHVSNYIMFLKGQTERGGGQISSYLWCPSSSVSWLRVLNTQTHTYDTNVTELNTHTHTTPSETGDIWTRLVDCINTNILAAILYQSFARYYPPGETGQHVQGISLYCFLQLQVSLQLSQNRKFNFLKKGLD